MSSPKLPELPPMIEAPQVSPQAMAEKKRRKQMARYRGILSNSLIVTDGSIFDEEADDTMGVEDNKKASIYG